VSKSRGPVATRITRSGSSARVASETRPSRSLFFSLARRRQFPIAPRIASRRENSISLGDAISPAGPNGNAVSRATGRRDATADEMIFSFGARPATDQARTHSRCQNRNHGRTGIQVVAKKKTAFLTLGITRSAIDKRPAAKAPIPAISKYASSLKLTPGVGECKALLVYQAEQVIEENFCNQNTPPMAPPPHRYRHNAADCAKQPNWRKPRFLNRAGSHNGVARRRCPLCGTAQPCGISAISLRPGASTGIRQIRAIPNYLGKRETALIWMPRRDAGSPSAKA